MEIIIYSLITAFVVGILHVLEPCEDKAIVSLYAAWSGKKKRETMKLTALYGLGMLIADTFLGIIAAFVGISFLSGISDYLGKTAAIITIIIGVLMLKEIHTHRFEQHCLHKDLKRISNERNILIFGIIRGLPPCPIEMGMLVWAASVGNVFYGALLVFVFSLGTMLSLLPFGFVAGGLAEWLRKRFGERSEHILPTIAAAVMIIIGIAMLFFNFD
jgi:sulfite exporter TauE/SafE